MNFEEYWGPKLLSALRVLHRLFFSEENLEDEQQEEDQGQDQASRDNWLFKKKQQQYKKKDQ
jgi:hypothetical protein